VTRRLLATALTALLLCAGCTDGSTTGDPGVSSRSPSPSPSSVSPSPSATPVVVPPAPEVAACYRLRTAELARPTSSARPVPCRSRHTARTIYVGRLDTVVDGHAVAVDSATVQRQLSTVCPRRLAGYLGGTRTERRLSRLNVVWFSPTLAQSDRGADWFRCDVVAFSRGDALQALPRKGSLRGVLDRPAGLDTFGLCGTAAPGAGGFERVICDRRHSWRAVDVIGIPGGKAYPGRGRVRTAGDARCKDEARARSGNSLRFRYGWEWPTGDQWRRGQHYGFCWAPD